MLIFPLVSTKTNTHTSYTSVANSAQPLAEPRTGKLKLITLIIFVAHLIIKPAAVLSHVYQVSQARSQKPLTPSH